MIASFFRAGKIQPLAQKIEQCRPWRDIESFFLAINPERDPVFLRHDSLAVGLIARSTRLLSEAAKFAFRRFARIAIHMPVPFLMDSQHRLEKRRSD